MNERLQDLRERVDSLETKERVLVLAACVLVLVAAWYTLLMQPLEVERGRLQSESTRLQATLAELNAQALQIVETSRKDPNEPLRRQIATSLQQTVTFEQQIRESAGQLISPREMARVLQSVLEKTQGLEFVSLEGLGAQPLIKPSKPGDAARKNGARTAYRHGFRIRFAGSYLKTIDYLRALEALPWRFFWEAVEVNVTDHPRASGSIVVYTLSLDRSWIGV